MTEPRDTDKLRERIRDANPVGSGRHMAYEPPEASATPHGGNERPMRPRAASMVDISVELETVERHGRWWAAIKNIIGGIAAMAAVCATIYGAVYKAVEHIAEKKFEDFVARFDPAVIIPIPTDEEVARLAKLHRSPPPPPPLLSEQFAAIFTAIAVERERISTEAKRVEAIEKRADAWDLAWRKRYPQRAGGIPMPALGPSAKIDGVQP